MNSSDKFFSFLAAAFLLVCCTDKTENVIPEEETNPDEPSLAEGMKRLYLRVCSYADFIPEDISSRTVVVNGKTSTPKWNPARRAWYVDVVMSSFDVYGAEMRGEGSSVWYADSQFSDISIPSVQFIHRAKDLTEIPLIAEYDPEKGNFLDFYPPYAVLDFQISGMEDIVSLKLCSSAPVCGTATWSRTNRMFVFKGNSMEAILNCTASVNPEHFPLIVFGHNLPSAVLRVCNASHKMAEIPLGDLLLEPGTVLTKSVTATPDAGLVWFEGFDRLVWGGDIVGEKSGVAPSTIVPTLDGDSELTGYEYALARVPSSAPGSGFVQKSFASQQLPVAQLHQMSDSYIRSRGFADMRYMLRCREYPGYISVGTGDTKRGWYAMFPMKQHIGKVKNLEITFDICLEPATRNDISFLVQGGESAIIKWYVDGVEGSCDAVAQRGVTDSLRLSPSLLGTGVWRKVRVLVDNCTDLTALHWQGISPDEGAYGFYLDEISVKEIPEGWDKKDKIRLLYWNIQNGMWGDQGNNYDNFVTFVRKYNPDICVWCEAKTNHETGSDASISGTPYLPGHWGDLASRYGHAYVAKAELDKFPQVVTSRYPVTLIKQLGSPLKHGAGIFKVETSRGPVYPLALHLRPDVNGTSTETERVAEMLYIIQNSVNDTSLGISGWMLIGDYNSTSRADAPFYGSDAIFQVHDYLAASTSLIDLFASRYPGSFMYTTGSRRRIDYIYMDKSAYARVCDACVLTEEWTSPVSAGIAKFYYPSDHRPMLVDLK